MSMFGPCESHTRVCACNGGGEARRIINIASSAAFQPFFANMNPTLSAKQMDQPGTIVREVLMAFEKNKRVVVPGKFKVWLGPLGARLLPRDLIAGMAAGTVNELNKK
jgi:hypothetical protein